MLNLRASQTVQGNTTYVSPPLEVPQETEKNHDHNRSTIQGSSVLKSNEQVITNRRNMLPFQYLWSEPLVSEAFRGIGKGILGRFQLHKVDLRNCVFFWIHSLIRMVYGSPKTDRGQSFPDGKSRQDNPTASEIAL